jgi:hypothetical protein
MKKINTRLVTHLSMLAIIIFNCTYCEYVDTRLKIENNSKNIVFAEISNDSIIKRVGLTEYYIKNQIKPREIKPLRMYGPKNAWHYYIQNCLNHRISIFIVDIDTILKYNDLKFILNSRRYLAKIEKTEDELNQISWIIKFPE